MARLQVSSFTRTLFLYTLLFIGHFKITNGTKFGLFAGDNKRHSSPLLINNIRRNTPVFIRINSGIPKLDVPPLLPIVRTQPPKLIPLELLKIKTSLSRNLPKALRTPRIPKLPLLPLIPPPLPLLPPLLPPILPLLPLLPLPLPSPLLSILPKLTSSLKPLKVPILGKKTLQKALSSEIKPIVLPSVDEKSDVLRKLSELKRQGSLTAAEYLRFKKLLLRK